MSKKLLKQFFAAMSFAALTFNASAQCDSASVVTLGAYAVEEGIPANGANTDSGVSEFGGNTYQATGSVWYSYTHETDVPGTLVISSCDGGADTRLFVHTGACSELELFGTADDECAFSPNDGDGYASRLEFPPVTGTTYLIEWDNKWDSNPFNWSVEFIPTPQYDIEVLGQSIPALPEDQASSVGFPIIVEANNVGLAPLTGITLFATVYSVDNDTRTPIDTFMVGPTELDTAATTTALEIDRFRPTEQGMYEIDFTATMNEEEPEANERNSMRTLAIEVTEGYYALESQEALGALNTSEIGFILQGQKYVIGSETRLASVDLALANGEGFDLMLKVLPVAENGIPGEAIYSQSFEATNNYIINVELDTILNLAPGTYFVGVESTTEESVDLYYDIAYNYADNALIYTDFGSGLQWRSLNELGREFTYLIRLNTAEAVVSGINDVTPLNGTVEVSPNPTTGIFNVNYALAAKADLNIRIVNALGQTVRERNVAQAENGVEAFDLSGLSVGVYSIILTDGESITTRRVVRQ